MKNIRKILSGIIALCLMGSMAVIPEVSMTASAELEDFSYSSKEACADYFYNVLYKQDDDSQQCSFDSECGIFVDESSGYVDILSEMDDGILGAVVEDLNNDGRCDILISRVTSYKEKYTSGKVISLQIYSSDDNDNMELMDEIEVSRFSSTNMDSYINNLSVVTADDGNKYIASFTPYYTQGKSKKIAILKVNGNCKFEVSDFFIDPGYTSGLGLYYTSSISADKIASASYYDIDKIYEVNAPSTPNFNTYYQLINNKLSKYGMSVKNTTESSYSANFSLSADNCCYISDVHLENYNDIILFSGIIDSYLPYKKCGENIDWSLDRDSGLLTISGTGIIDNPTWELNHIEKLLINEVVIDERITAICEYAFYDSCLSSVSVPESVNSIGECTFGACYYLDDVTILNPECEILDRPDTISNEYNQQDYKPYFYGTIHGYENSTAQAYAEKYGYNFESLGEYTGLPLGNVNGDNLIDAVDSSIILAEYALLSTESTPTFTYAQKKSADVNGDGLIDAVDATLVLSYYAETSTGNEITLQEFIAENAQ